MVWSLQDYMRYLIQKIYIMHINIAVTREKTMKIITDSLVGEPFYNFTTRRNFLIA